MGLEGASRRSRVEGSPWESEAVSGYCCARGRVGRSQVLCSLGAVNQGGDAICTRVAPLESVALASCTNAAAGGWKNGRVTVGSR